MYMGQHELLALSKTLCFIGFIGRGVLDLSVQAHGAPGACKGVFYHAQSRPWGLLWDPYQGCWYTHPDNPGQIQVVAKIRDFTPRLKWRRLKRPPG